uniref:Uncharacterized protein n=1 Tax=Cacopsylla melanoneura TaxID=428564 RepID=A0A8D8VJP8_9HEMI
MLTILMRRKRKSWFMGKKLNQPAWPPEMLPQSVPPPIKHPPLKNLHYSGNTNGTKTISVSTDLTRQSKCRSGPKRESLGETRSGCEKYWVGPALVTFIQIEG